MDRLPTPEQAHLSASAFTPLYRSCAEHAWRAGHGDDFLIMLEALRLQFGAEPLGTVNRRLIAACDDDPHRRYILAVTLAVMDLTPDEQHRRRAILAILDWSQTVPRPDDGRLRQAWRRLRSLLHRHGRRPATG